MFIINISKSLLDFLEENDVTISPCKRINTCVDLTFYTLAEGTDVKIHFTITVDCTNDESFVKGVIDEYENFDVDERITLSAENRAAKGYLFTIEDLIEETESVKRSLGELSAGLEKAFKKIKEDVKE